MENNSTSPAHTDGIWEVRPQIGPEGIERYCVVVWNDERTIARTLASTTTATPEDEANAYRMAAARRLLAACYLAVEEIEQWDEVIGGSEDERTQIAIGALRDAIASAYGNAA